MKTEANPLSWGYAFFALTFFPVMWSRSLALFICYGVLAMIWSYRTMES